MDTTNLTPATALPQTMRDRLTTWADANRMANPSRVLLKHGHLDHGGVLAPAQFRGPAGECFFNSMRALGQLTGSRATVLYCEGYAYQPRYDVVFEHAWLLVDGQVWETTWPSADNVTYLGMTFHMADVMDLLESSEETPLFDDWDRDFRLLTACGTCCSQR